jgi:hypothetical protein
MALRGGGFGLFSLRDRGDRFVSAQSQGAQGLQSFGLFEQAARFRLVIPGANSVLEELFGLPLGLAERRQFRLQV